MSRRNAVRCVDDDNNLLGTSSYPIVTTASAASSNLEGGGKVSVGTTAVEVTFTGTPLDSVIITADRSNTGILYVGKSNVTSAGANALTFLEAGDSVTLDYDDADNALYVVASAASQNFWKGALL